MVRIFRLCSSIKNETKSKTFNMKAQKRLKYYKTPKPLEGIWQQKYLAFQRTYSHLRLRSPRTHPRPSCPKWGPTWVQWCSSLTTILPSPPDRMMTCPRSWLRWSWATSSATEATTGAGRSYYISTKRLPQLRSFNLDSDMRWMNKQAYISSNSQNILWN